MINKEIEEFKKYVSNFDISIEAIDMKYNHTLRVVGYADRITTEVTDPDLKRLSLIGALLHDISRFKQWTEYRTFEDAKSFDHGDMGYEILVNNDYINNYVQNDYEKEVVLNAVKQHNKKELELTGDFKTDFVAKVVRDADKIDILDKQYNLADTRTCKYRYVDYLNEFGEYSDKQFDINDKLFDDVVNHRMCANKDVKYFFDAVLRELAFIYDVNFKSSFKIIKDLKIIESKRVLLETLNKKEENRGKIDLIIKTISDFYR